MTYTSMLQRPTTGQFFFAASVRWFDEDAGVAQERRYRTMERALEVCADLRVQGINALVVAR